MCMAGIFKPAEYAANILHLKQQQHFAYLKPTLLIWENNSEVCVCFWDQFAL